MENTSLKNGNIHCMDIICNIQTMNEVINASVKGEYIYYNNDYYYYPVKYAKITYKTLEL